MDIKSAWKTDTLAWICVFLHTHLHVFIQGWAQNGSDKTPVLQKLLVYRGD